MRKVLIFSIFSLMCLSLIGAYETKSSNEPETWDVIQVGFARDIPSSTAYTPCYGLKIGLPICGGKADVYGVEAAVLNSGSDNVDGLQASIISTTSKDAKGVQFSIVNICEKLIGLQFGIVNLGKKGGKLFQLGLINYIEGSSIPVLPIVNVSF